MALKISTILKCQDVCNNVSVVGWGLPRVCDVGGGPAEGGGETHVGVGEVREEAGVGAEGGLQRDDRSVKS